MGIEASPTLLSAWGGSLVGFNISRWVHALSSNVKKMMGIMEQVTKLVRSNKFLLDTVVFKVGDQEQDISDYFVRASDQASNAQVVLGFPTLEEELEEWKQEQG